MEKLVDTLGQFVHEPAEDCGCNKQKKVEENFTLLLSFKAPKKEHLKWVNIISSLLAEHNLELDRFESYRY